MRFEINENCVSCLACVRVCPSQAIAVDGSKVRIVEESCTRVGQCVPACPHDAIDVVGDAAEALALAQRGDAVITLSVEAEVYFHPHAPEQVVNACYEAGFRTVHRGVLGDELVATEYRRLFARPGWGTMIRSTCPLVVRQIRHDYPGLVPYLAPVKTPLAAEAEYLRGLHGADVKIVYVGVCVAEANSAVDAVLTFGELDKLFQSRGVELGKQPLNFTRIPGVRQRHVSTAGGLPLPVLQQERQTSGRFRKVRGLEALGAIERAVVVDEVDLGFVDILPCEGCLDHPLLGPRDELYRRRQLARQAEPPRSPVPVVDDAVKVRVDTAFEILTDGQRPSDDEIEAVINRIGRAPDGTHWDCRACGYETCVRFASALLKGRATLRSCLPYQERLTEQAQLLAAVDELTGLASYRVLRDRLEQEVARSGRSNEPFSVLFLDIDRFKEVNDLYGHEAGNRVLMACAEELRRVVRKTDLAARYGGDEFVAVLVRTHMEGALHVGEVMREAVESVGRKEGYPEGMITVSVGAACYDPVAGSDREVLAAADKALYGAKAAGRNRVMTSGVGHGWR